MPPVTAVEGPGTIELWLVDLVAAATALDTVEAHTPRLSPVELEKIARMADLSIGRERRAAYIALRLLIERAFGPAWRTRPFDISPAGKPSLPGANGHFSLSHVSGLALVGLAPNGSIGVDIERTRAIRMTEDRRAGVERAGVELGGGAPLTGSSDDRLLRAWVRLEAVAKAEGCGIGTMLSRFGVSRGGVGEGEAGVVHRTHDVPLGDGMFAAVALPFGQSPPHIVTLPVAAAALEALAARAN